MRTLAIGDIHGCLTALTTLLDYVAPAPEDLIVAVGDYVDRGPDSRGVLDHHIALYATGRLVVLRGNHEQMMCAAREDEESLRMWLACGGRETLASYGATVIGRPGLDRVPAAHWHFLEKTCVDWFETAAHFFVHANAFPDVPLEEQPRVHAPVGGRFYQPVHHMSGKVMICGHTRQLDGVPRNLGSTVCIDTGAHDRQGWLTCLDVATGLFWQANQQGQRRSGILGWRKGILDMDADPEA